MAQKIIYICDRCGKEFSDRDILPYGYPQLSVCYTYKEYDCKNDLCIDCQKELKRWMAGAQLAED